MRPYLLFLCTVFLLLNCENSLKREQERKIAFYHWKTTLDLDSTSNQYLDSLNCQKVYVRIFDVKWVPEKNNAYPFATLKCNKTNPIAQTTIPVVYITNESVQKTSISDIPSMARNIVFKINQITEQPSHVFQNVSEVQFDCDWSETTQSKYFQLLDNIRAIFTEQNKNYLLSCTIRLHQIKYQDITGVPPVDKGVLMFYNMGELSNTSTINSILDLNTAEKYMVGFDQYPLKMDVALPLFSWAVQIRQDKVVRLLNEIKINDLQLYPEIKNITHNNFEVQESFYLGNNYLYKGDKLRIESIQLDQLSKAIEMIDNNIKNKDYELVFYHLDPVVQSNFKAADLQKLK